MSYDTEYKSKFRTADQAVEVVKSGDWVDYAFALSQPFALDAALAKRKNQLQDIKIRGTLALRPLQVVENDREREVFTYCSWHFTGYERKLHDAGLCTYIPLIFRTMPQLYRQELPVDVAMIGVTPMDEYGYFNFSMSAAALKAIADKAKIVIVEENSCLPRALGKREESLHISEVDFIVRHDRPLPALPVAAPDDMDKKVAASIVEEIVDGATIQLGIGGMPNAVGNMIAESGLKDIGMHTEMLVDAYLAMYRTGKLTNKKKTLDPGKGIWAFGIGSQELYDWVDNNPGLCTSSVDYVNDPHVIAQLDNFVSVNNCIEVDLFGQVSSESSGYRHISGTGGQVDFVTGAYAAKGGKSFICFKATYTGKEAEQSRVVPVLPPGSIVTAPRSQIHYLVSEWGKVNLMGASNWERAERIISIAHPAFRDDLIKQAEKMNIWRKSNKK